MKKFSKIILISTLLFFLLNAFSFIVLAQDDVSDLDDLEVTYPNLVTYVNAPQGTRTYLPDYIKYVYIFSVFASGFIAFACFLIGGFRYLTSVGNPGIMQDARDQMFSGVIGMLVIFGSYLILNELNPDLTSFAIPQISVLNKGIIIYSDENCGDGADGTPYMSDLAGKEIKFLRIGDTKTSLSTDQKNLWTINSFYSYHDRETLSVSFYKDKDCSGRNDWPDASYELNEGCCNKNGCRTGGGAAMELDNIGCIKLVWRSPGVWLFNYENGNPLNPDGREGIEYVNYQSSREEINDEIKEKVKSIALVRSKDDYYGAIIHNLPLGSGTAASRGWAEILLPVRDQDITVYNLSGNDESHVGSITIFRVPTSTNPPDFTDEFVLYRELSKELSADKGIVIPQFNIAWNKISDDIDETLMDLTNDLCKEAKINSVINAKNDADSSSWPTATNCGGLLYVVGGVRLKDKYWLDEKNAKVVYKGKEKVVDFSDSSVKGIYLPSGTPYIALLYEEKPDGDGEASLIKLARYSSYKNSSKGTWSNAGIIFGSYSNLGTVTWGKNLATLVVVRIKE